MTHEQLEEVERLQQRVRELEEDGSDFRDAERWRFFADAAVAYRTSNGDNAFIHYHGPDVVADCRHNEEDGTVWTPGTPDEWIDQLMAEDRAAKAKPAEKVLDLMEALKASLARAEEKGTDA